MGWDSCDSWTTKQIVVDEIVREYGANLVAYKTTKSGMWAIIRTAWETNPVELIVLEMLEKQGGSYSRKSVSEDMGPYTFDCPLEFLAMQPVVHSEDAKNWRARVVSYHAAQTKRKAIKKAVNVGDTVKLTNGWTLNVVSLKPFVGLKDGKKYRIPAKMLVPDSAEISNQF